MKTITTFFVLATLFFVTYSSSGSWEAKNDFPDNSLSDTLAVEALQNYDDIKQNNLKLEKVIDCSTQIVSGLNYKITAIYVNEATKLKYIVKAQIYVQSWTKTTKVTSCDIDIDENSTSVIAKAAKIAEEKIRSETNLMDTDQYIGYELIETQIVAGKKYTFHINFENSMNNETQQFEATVWVRDWLNSYEVIDMKQIDNTQKAILTISLNQNNEEDEDIEVLEKKAEMKAVEAAKTVIVEQTNLMDIYQYTNYKILDRKIVSGTIYTIEIDYTNEMNNESKQFIAQVWAKPWENFYEVTNIKDKVPSLSSADAGGYTHYNFDANANSTDQKIINTIKKYMESKSNLQAYEFVKVVKAQSQVVAGVNYLLQVEIRKEKTTIVADVNVYSRPWENEFMEVTSFEMEKPIIKSFLPMNN